MFKRKIYDRMVSWKEEEKRSVLIIEGAGGVGKTSTVEEFGKNEYGSYIRIDLSKKSRSMRVCFWTANPIPWVSSCVCRP